METLADCGPIDMEMEAVSSEMEVTMGLLQKLVDENTTQKLDQQDYRKRYAGRYTALESRMDRLEKSGRGEIQYDLFRGFLARISEIGELPMDFNEKLRHRLVNYATVYPNGKVVFPSAMARKSGRRIKAGSGQGIRFVPDVSGHFFLRMEIKCSVYGNL